MEDRLRNFQNPSNFVDINELFIQANRGNCFEHIAGWFDICLYVRISLLIPVCAVHVCLCAFDIKSEY